MEYFLHFYKTKDHILVFKKNIIYFRHIICINISRVKIIKFKKINHRYIYDYKKVTTTIYFLGMWFQLKIDTVISYIYKMMNRT